MIKLMLDTNILIYIIKHKPESVIKHFLQYKPQQIGISSIVYAEIMDGIYNSQQIERNLNAFHALVDNLIMVDFNPKAAALYGEHKARLKKIGQLISDNDLLIGCHALALGLPLISNNIREYQRIDGLKLENWV